MRVRSGETRGTGSPLYAGGACTRGDVCQPRGMVAKQVIYTGRVQGVGFRYATKQLASGFDVSGWVRNLPDGRVELLAIAFDAEELEAFLTELQENSALANHIKETETHKVPAPTDVKGFSIVR